MIGAQPGLEPPHLLRREVRVERRPVRRVLGRIEVERRPPAGERELRHDVLHGGRERRRVLHGGDDVVVAASAPRSRCRRRCARPGSAAGAPRTPRGSW